MTLRDHNRITQTGDPITGKAPTRVRVMNKNTVTELQNGLIAKAYKKFTTDVTASITPTVLQDLVLIDGTRIRMESKYGRDVVQVWPKAGNEQGKITVTPPFFCIPFDETYRITPKQDTYFLSEISEPNLGKLKKATDCVFIPKIPVTGGTYMTPPFSHPGNQTWFANLVVDGKEHEHAKYVLSWWGQPNRYSQSPLDVVLTTGKLLYYKQGKLVNGWTDAIYGVLYRTFTGVMTSMGVVPPYTQSAVPYYASSAETYSNALTGVDTTTADSSRKAIWLNAVRFTTDFIVHSACIGKRDGKTVVRIFTQNSTTTFSVREFSLSTLLNNMEEGGTLSLVGGTTYNITMPLPGGSAASINYMVHPFYWNADGSEAMGLFAFTRVYSSTVSVVGTALLKLNDSTTTGFTVTLMETTSYVHTSAETNNPAPAKVGNNYAVSGSATWDITVAYDYVLAADYDGITPKILRGHVSEVSGYTAASSESSVSTSADTGGLFTYGTSIEAPGYVYYSNARNRVNTYTARNSSARHANAISRVSLSAVDIVALTDECAIVQSTALTIDDNSGYIQTSGSRLIEQLSPTALHVEHFTQRSQIDQNYRYKNSISGIQSGHASYWAVAGGDLRGGNVVLRESPWLFRVPDTQPTVYTTSTWIDLSETSTDIHNKFYGTEMTGSRVGKETVVTNSGTRLTDTGTNLKYNANVGRFVHINTKTAEHATLCKLLYNDYYSSLGSNTTSYGAISSYTAVLNSVDVVVSYTLGPEERWSTSSSTNAEGEAIPGSGVNTWYAANTTMHFGIYPEAKANDPEYRQSSFNPPVKETYTGAGGPTHVAFSSGAVSPDGKFQYIGIVSVALATPNTNNVTATPLIIDQWFYNGAKMTPSDPYPYEGAYKMLSCPVFTGGWTEITGTRKIMFATPELL